MGRGRRVDRGGGFTHVPVAYADGGNDLIPATVPGGDDPGLRGVVVERTTYFPDGLGDAADRKRIVTPNALEQLVARNHRRRAPDQILQHLEGLRSKRYFSPVCILEAMQIRIKLESIERITHGSLFL